MSGKESTRSLFGAFLFHAGFIAVVASPWLLDGCGLLDFFDALCNWRGCGYENLGYWMGYRA